MGEVYRARDVRLERTVAIKILPPQFASDPIRKQRFEREAKTVSALSHPHICALYDLGSQDDVNYLVMEYLEGETLAKLLEKGPLPLEQVLKCGIQICDALDKAHRGGVVHRDLKPGNIMLTPTGVKLLDFGLAKSVAPADCVTTLTAALTQSSEMTEPGAIVGTIPYMSPEQVGGKELDGRSDIFSLGAVLYEMLTAERAFGGKSQFSVASAILEKDPVPISTLKPLTPPALDHAITLCLVKDREERWQTSRDLGLELKWVAEAGSVTRLTPRALSRGKFRERLAWAVAAALVISCMAIPISLMKRVAAPARVLRSSLLPPPGSSFLPYNFAIAPDGSRMAFVALGPDGLTSLWVRGLSSPNAQQLTGTQGGTFPFWSPNSLQLGFFAQGRLKTVDLVNSAVQSLCEAAPGFGGTWNQEGIIVFSPGITGPLYRVSAMGGTPEAVTKVSPGSGESHHFPVFLPDGKHFLYFVNWSDTPRAHSNGLYAASLGTDAPKLISPDVQGNALFASGNLLYARDRTIVAQPFDTNKLQTTGAALPLTQQEIDRFFDFWQSGFSVSQDGKMLFQSASDAPTRLVWYDATGKEIGQFTETGYEGPQFSRDGRFLAVYSDDEHNGKHFIRIYDLKRGVSARLTDGGNESNPVWSSDSRFIAYRDASLNIEEVPVDSSGPPRPLVKGTNVIPCDWSADGQLIYMSIGGGAPFPGLYSLKDQEATQVAKFGAEAQLSPDGKWIAYVERPTAQIVVQPFPGPGVHIQISQAVGSTQPRWSHNGRIFFVQPDRKIMVVAFDPANHSASPPQIFARTRIVTTVFGWFQYAVASDDRLLVNSLPADNSSPLTIVTNWTAELKK